jgi:hypothetical protein
VTPPVPKKPTDSYDERIYRKGHPPHRMRNALILIGIVLVGTYLAVTKSLPFGSEYELKAVFENAANIRKDSPVRIAGVNVGKVKSVASVGDAEVTFSVDEETSAAARTRCGLRHIFSGPSRRSQQPQRARVPDGDHPSPRRRSQSSGQI